MPKPARAKKCCFLNAYRVVRKAPKPGPGARVLTHGYVLGSLPYTPGSSHEKKKAYRELYTKHCSAIRLNGAIYKHPNAVALWIFGESHQAEDWVDE